MEERIVWGEFVRELNKLVIICSSFGKGDLLFYCIKNEQQFSRRFK
jgi:hypothetical protein